MKMYVSAEAAGLVEKHKRKGEKDRDVLDRLLGITRINLLNQTKPKGFDWVCDAELSIDPEGYVDLHLDYPDGIRFSVPYRGIAR